MKGMTYLLPVWRILPANNNAAVQVHPESSEIRTVKCDEPEQQHSVISVQITHSKFSCDRVETEVAKSQVKSWLTVLGYDRVNSKHTRGKSSTPNEHNYLYVCIT